MKVPIWKIWLSDKPLPDHFKQYTDTWDKISGGEVTFVDMTTVNNYLPKGRANDLLEDFNGNYTVLNHCIRYLLMYKFGGVYLDLDVEVIKDSDIWYSNIPTFFEETPGWRNNHVMISKYDYCSVFMSLFEHAKVVYPLTEKKEINTGPGLVTEVLKLYALNVNVYRSEYTTPWNWNEKPDRSRITENTIAVHHFAHSWKK